VRTVFHTAMSTPAVVIDNGTGYTKMGYAGNWEPSHIIPTAVATSTKKTAGAYVGGLEDLDYYIGDEAYDPQIMHTHTPHNPISHGQIANWDLMEKIWHQSFYQYLHCDPEHHNVVLTEPPMNDPTNREYTAEIMFETFNVPGLHIAVQAVLALIASWSSKKAKSHSLTGTVIDSGDGVTHIIPVSDGYVIGSCIKHIPIAGRDITDFVYNIMKDREVNIPASEAKRIARETKENTTYCCQDMLKEFKKYDNDPASNMLEYEGEAVDGQKKTKFKYSVGYERFLAPEIFFNPSIYSTQAPASLPDLVDEVICQCPLDTRRNLYSNIVLSGGSTLYKNFGKRLQKDVKGLVDTRMKDMVDRSGGSIQPKPLDVSVLTHDLQRYAVWFGGSMLANMPAFPQSLTTRAQYDECGPSIMRRLSVVEM